MRRGRSQAGQGRFFLETCSEKRSRIASEDCRRTLTANEGQNTTRGTVLAMSLFCPDRLAVSWLQGSSEQSDSCWHSEERPQSQAWPITPAVQRTGSASNAQKAKKIPVVCLRAICSSLVTRQTTVNNIIVGTLSPPLDIRPTRLRAASVSREPQTIVGKGDTSLKSEARQQRGDAGRCAYDRVNPYGAGFSSEPRQSASGVPFQSPPPDVHRDQEANPDSGTMIHATPAGRPVRSVGLDSGAWAGRRRL